MRRFAVIVAALLALVGCKYKEPVVSSGSYTIDGVTYSFSSLRVDHVGYENGDSTRFILRLTGYPGTFTMDTVKRSGYGTVLQIFVIAQGCELYPGDRCTEISRDSVSRVVTIGENCDTTLNKTLSAATVAVSAADNNFLRYDFTFTTNSVETSGEYTGKHAVNRLVDQPACGALAFDTISTRLAVPVVYNWGHLFSNDFFYHEFIFYSTNARFSDDGKLRQGIQFSVGITSSDEHRPLGGSYIVANSFVNNSVIYGHKNQDANWGTYWTVFYAGASVGKASILAGKLDNLTITDTHASFTFNFTDQLNNDVIGSFDGRVIYQKNY